MYIGKKGEPPVKNIVVADYINSNKKAHNLTFEYISGESGVPLSTVNAYSKGLFKEPKEDTVVRIASVWHDTPEVVRALYKSFVDFEEKAKEEKLDGEITDRFVDKISPIIIKLLTESREDSDARYNRRLERVGKQYADLYSKQEEQYKRSVAYLQKLVKHISFALVAVVLTSFIFNAAVGAYAVYAYLTFDVADHTRGIYQGSSFHHGILAVIIVAMLFAALIAVFLAHRVISNKPKQ